MLLQQRHVVQLQCYFQNRHQAMQPTWNQCGAGSSDPALSAATRTASIAKLPGNSKSQTLSHALCQMSSTVALLMPSDSAASYRVFTFETETTSKYTDTAAVVDLAAVDVRTGSSWCSLVNPSPWRMTLAASAVNSE
jgi:hypothetical protein